MSEQADNVTRGAKPDAPPPPARQPLGTCARCGYEFQGKGEYVNVANSRKVCRNMRACRERGGKLV
jgi:hypothetical protein